MSAKQDRQKRRDAVQKCQGEREQQAIAPVRAEIGFLLQQARTEEEYCTQYRWNSPPKMPAVQRLLAAMHRIAGSRKRLFKVIDGIPLTPDERTLVTEIIRHHLV